MARQDSWSGKNAYGHAFAIYGLAAYYALSENPEALRLAQDTFHWLEQHSHDPVHGGYFQALRREGGNYGNLSGAADPEAVRLTFKDQNSSIHLMEAFTELYRVWPDSLLRERLRELLHLVRDTITHPDGYMRLFFYPDWTPVSYRDSLPEVREANYVLDHVSFGHDIETAYLMLETAEVLGEEYEATLAKARKMVDHSLAYGWDRELGGFYERGYYFAGQDSLSIIWDRKNWWAQAEGMHSLLLFSGLFPEKSAYREAFIKQWRYINRYLIDHEHGGWYQHGIDVEPESQRAHKGHNWKAAYHTGRALMQCIRLLQKQAPDHQASP
jgi:mannobiose 2-epimerase